MSVQTEINRIKANVSAAYTAASNMGATMPSSQNSANLANTILTIPTGGWPDTITPGDMPVLISETKYAVETGTGTYDTGLSLTIPKAGTYRIKCTFEGYRNGTWNQAQLRVNDVTKHTATANGSYRPVMLSVDLALAAGDVLKIYCTGSYADGKFIAGPIIACIAFDGYEDFIG